MVACVKLESASPGVEPGPLASEASVLLPGHLLPKHNNIGRVVIGARTFEAPAEHSR